MWHLPYGAILSAPAIYIMHIHVTFVRMSIPKVGVRIQCVLLPLILHPTPLIPISIIPHPEMPFSTPRMHSGHHVPPTFPTHHKPILLSWWRNRVWQWQIDACSRASMAWSWVSTNMFYDTFETIGRQQSLHWSNSKFGSGFPAHSTICELIWLYGKLW